MRRSALLHTNTLNPLKRGPGEDSSLPPAPKKPAMAVCAVTPNTRPASSQGQAPLGPQQAPGQPLHGQLHGHLHGHHGQQQGQQQGEAAAAAEARFFRAFFAKAGPKKHKNFDDGVVRLCGMSAVLFDMEGKQIGKSTAVKGLAAQTAGCTMSIGGYEVELEAAIAKSLFDSGSVFLKQAPAPAQTAPAASSASASTSTSQQQQQQLSRPFQGHFAQSHAQHSVVARPLFDPATVPNALVLNPRRGPAEVAVVADPAIARVLRPHQREGLSFMYECVMGLREGLGGTGCVLADEMGLGKTIQTIALIWTLLKQGPEGRPAIKRAVIVCPSSLVENWRAEVRKWLGDERLRTMAVEAGGAAESSLSDFEHGYKPVLVISYEMFRKWGDKIAAIKSIGLVVCDEGHRLKNDKIKTSQALSALPTARRVVLTGTPVQNHLDEFFCMVEFCNPGVFGTPQSFRRVFADPIEAGRVAGAPEAARALSEARSEELLRITRGFLLRRTADIMAMYLPPKTEAVVFCRPTEQEKRAYREVSSAYLGPYATSAGTDALAAIQALRRVCSDDLRTSKLALLAGLLGNIRAQSADRVVLVSTSTRALDLVGTLLDGLGLTHVRLDGSTPADKRMALVDAFNRRGSPTFAFLLSAKAGGVGLNLVGANRLVLLDPDWNPSTDLQAMARVHRDGQTKPVVIYRLLTTGTIEEKIFQRQIKKVGLSDRVVDDDSASNPGSSSFTLAELRDLFRLREDTDSDTYELLKDEDPAWAKSGQTNEQPETSQEVKANLMLAGCQQVSFIHIQE
jgi:DNA repair and recombination protein RAD54B